jgi:hypothetical protein
MEWKMTKNGRRDALRALLEQVEAGTATGRPDALAVPREQSRLIAKAFGDDDEIWSNVVAAHEGSLDAAKALHEAVLPGWWYSFHSHGLAFLVSPDCRITPSANNPDPARAWLICIILALIEEATASDATTTTDDNGAAPSP